jgi:fused signal recognition particle receptor
VFDGVKQATATGEDVLIVDTAGRLQNKQHLMDELAKIRRVLGRLNPEAPHDVLLVLDATTGQNALASRGVPRERGRDRPHHDQARRHRARRRSWSPRRRSSACRSTPSASARRIDDLRPFDPREVAGNCRTAARMTAKAEPQGAASC